MKYRWVRVDHDRPHKCPRCWKPSASPHGRGVPRWWFIYRCEYCKVRWLRLWGNLWNI